MQAIQLFHRVRHTMTRYQMLQPKETVLVAVSGGADSMCLLHLLLEISKKGDFSVQVATFNHQIRPEGAQDAAFVRDWCRSQGVPCHVGTGDVPAEAERLHQGLEETARQMRYAFLERTAADIGATKLATAHNANDNAETLLLHLLRGTGLNGLGGIAPVRGHIIRPLIEVARQDIEQYLDTVGVPHVEDATNSDTAYSRNYIRHEVLPLLLQKNPKLLTSLTHTAQTLREDEAYLSQQALTVAQSAACDGVSIRIPVERIAPLPDAVANRVLSHLMEQLGYTPSGANRAALLQLCRSAKPSARLTLAQGVTAQRSYQTLLLTRERERQPFAPVTLRAGEQITLPQRTLRCELARCPAGKFNRPNEYYIRGDEQTTLVVRPRQTGDAITLPSRGRKTLKKLFIEHKLPQRERDQIAVLSISGQLAAVDGFGADCAFLPQAGELCLRVVGLPPV